MSDSLSSFIASGIEFIVGGLMLLGSLAFLLLAVGWEPPPFLTDLDLGSQDTSLVVLGVALAAAYAAGIIGEGVSRLVMEWDLTRVTAAHSPFKGHPERGSKDEREYQRALAMTRPELSTAERYDGEAPVNLGAGREIRIRELAERIADLTGFRGTILWDASKPDGQPRRCLDVSRAEKEFGFRATTDFVAGLRETIRWYRTQCAASAPKGLSRSAP